jgi:hypothetical protein
VIIINAMGYTQLNVVKFLIATSNVSALSFWDLP